MAGCIYHDIVGAEHDDDGKLLVTVEQPVRETAPPYISVSGDVALSVREARDLRARLALAIRAAERHMAQDGAVAA